MIALGLLLLVAAFALLLAEAHISTGGLIAGGAALALIFGSALLSIGAGAGSLIVLSIVASVCIAAVGGLMLLGRSLRSVRRLRPRAGPEAMVGHIGIVRITDSVRRVWIDGGLWRTRPSPLEEGHVLHDGDSVVVERVNGLTLSVRKAEEWELYP